MLHAKSRDDLLTGNVRILHGGKKRRAGFQPEVVRQQQEDGRKQHREWLESIRLGQVVLPPPVPWAIGYASMLGQNITEVQARQFAHGLEAVYMYSKLLCGLVINGSYNFEKHQGDWIDLQQLHYLCDADIYLLTDDRKLRKRVENSSQGTRILDFRNFLTSRGFTFKH